jgi:hypothetical protein
MFHRLFTSSRAVDRHSKGPLLEFDTQLRLICYAQESTSIRFALGLGTSRLTQPISTLKQIWR